MAHINPEILEWARNTAGFTVDVATKKLNIKDSKDLSAHAKLRNFELGLKEPSRSLLRRMAEKYRRPLITFYMSEPPVKGDRGQDFRTLPEDQPKTEEALLDALVRNIKARQSMVKTILEDDENLEDISYIGSVAKDIGVDDLASKIKTEIGFNKDDYRKCRTPNDAFTYLRALIEDTGVFVLLIGNLGNHCTAIDTKTFRGFALSDKHAPFIVINDQDAHAAWNFTLLHEMVHLWLGQTGISGASAEKSIEKFCNDVAGEILLPTESLEAIVQSFGEDFDEIKHSISSFAESINVSSSMVAYKLFRLNYLEADEWRKLSSFYRAAWVSSKVLQRQKAKEKEGGGPTYYITRRHRLGRTFINFVGQTLATGAVTTTKAAKILGVKPGKVMPLIEFARIS